MIGFLKWLGSFENVFIEHGGNHNIIFKYLFWDRPFPIPCSHHEINKNIVKALMEKLVESQICTKEEFDERIK